MNIAQLCILGLATATVLFFLWLRKRMKWGLNELSSLLTVYGTALVTYAAVSLAPQFVRVAEAPQITLATIAMQAVPEPRMTGYVVNNGNAVATNQRLRVRVRGLALLHDAFDVELVANPPAGIFPSDYPVSDVAPSFPAVQETGASPGEYLLPPLPPDQVLGFIVMPSGLDSQSVAQFIDSTEIEVWEVQERSSRRMAASPPHAHVNGGFGK